MAFWTQNKTTVAEFSKTPGFVLDAATRTLHPLPLPVDLPDSSHNVPPQPGDDPTPPNGVSQDNLNGIALLVSASAGFSTAPPRPLFHPSGIHYSVDVSASFLSVLATLEFANPHYDSTRESMIVKAKVAKSVAIPQSTELKLVSTIFQDWDDGAQKWVDISTRVAYTAQAEAVVAAVVATASDQTAGMATVKNESYDVTLGPVGSKGRILLRFSCGAPLSYDKMGTALDGSDIGLAKLIPVAFFLPWTQLSDENGVCNISFDVNSDAGASVLPISTNLIAYHHLKSQNLLESSTMIAVGSLKCENSKTTAEYSWSTLPISPTYILLWLSIPNDDTFGFELLNFKANNDIPTEKPLRAVVLNTSPQDHDLLTFSLPGSGYIPAQLTRIRIETPKISIPRINPIHMINILLSDASGSTYANCSGGGVVRDRFNAMMERRFLKRLLSIPVLLQARILQIEDVWTDVAIIFNHTMREHRVLSFKIGDFNASTISYANDGKIAVNSETQNCTPATIKIAQDVVSFVSWMRTIQPGGGTDFVAPMQYVLQMQNSIFSASGLIAGITNVDVKSFIDFDTDGGHNGTSTAAATALQSLVSTFKVKSGVVTGFGSWVNQECASRMAEILGPFPALLGLYVPKIGEEGMDKIFATGFTAWVDALRHESFRITVSAGADVYQHSKLGSTNIDALQVVASTLVKGIGQISFDAMPDVSNVNYTGATITGVASGDVLLLYGVSRLDPIVLAQRLEIKVNGVSNTQIIQKIVENEDIGGNDLAFKWMSAVAKKDIHCVFNPSVAVSNFLARIEDNLSFSFNLPALSGVTSYLGRIINSGDRANIDSAHQPEDPVDLLKNDNVRSLPPPGMSFGFGMPATSTSSFGFAAFGSATNVRPFAGSSLSSSRESTAPATAGGNTGGLFSTTQPGSFGRGMFGSAAGGSAGGLFASSNSIEQSKQQVNAPRMRKRTSQDQNMQQQQNQKQILHPYFGNAMDSNLWTQVLVNTNYLKIFTGSESKKNTKILEALSLVDFSLKKITGQITVEYFCDFCNGKIVSSNPRWHCFDCSDFDECSSCHANRSHESANLFHRVRNMGSSTVDFGKNDTLVNLLLQQTPVPQPATRILVNRTDVENTARIRRLVLVMIDWWAAFRFSFRSDSLPEVLDAAFVTEMKNALHDSVLTNEVVAKILDTLQRNL
ncbi:hypothetical protein HK100_010696 [Physocladia obscura]|uniref:ZZ-type domain-containing protein n=1 Tax=Physocladia obscura TaxID=109957 RepID=A0AAD5TAD6_9FUNG|nr:hypothetical protein HK100_010696 [Physocladia obscura]